MSMYNCRLVGTKFLLEKKLGSVFSLVAVLFVVYFISASGLYNSADAPQYFTVKSLLEKNSVDISGYANSAHYFVFPDIFYGRNGETFGVRGYMTSVMTIPFYQVGQLVSGLVNTDGFPVQATVAADFKTELVVTGLFGAFTALGIGYLVAVLAMMGTGRWMRWFLGLAVGLGTYAWKYANLISRHGLEVFYIGMVGYLVVKFSKGKNNGKSMWWCLGGLWGTALGIDVSLFVGLSLFLGVWLWLNTPRRLMFKIVALAMCTVGCQVLLNFHWYGQVSSWGTTKQPTVLGIVGPNRINEVWLSTPWWPAVRSVLFNWGKLGTDSFSNFDNYPKELRVFASADFAQRYNFYGIFAISPFLLFVLLSGFWYKSFDRMERDVVLFSLIIFIFGVGLNAKVLNFWGGNQYDVRYFYPFASGLILPVGLVVNKMRTTKWWTAKLLFGAAVMFSIFMGWMGQLNMFKPALTGERKIWIEAPGDIFKSKLEDGQLLQSTFYNLGNFQVGLVLVGVGIVLLMIVSRLTKFAVRFKKRWSYKDINNRQL